MPKTLKSKATRVTDHRTLKAVESVGGYGWEGPERTQANKDTKTRMMVCDINYNVSHELFLGRKDGK